MTDAELIETMFKYFMTRGGPAGPGHWKRISDEFKRRIREDTQARFDADYERRSVSHRAAGREEAA